MGKLLRSLAIATLAAAAAIGCTVHQADAPPMTGPSTFALAINATATPDTLVKNGSDKATIRVAASDAASRPIANLGVSLQVTSNGNPVNYGTLSNTVIYTGSDGTASATYTAPVGVPSLSGTSGCHGLSGECVTILVNPIGSNYQNTSFNHPTVDIRLAPAPPVPVDPSQPQALFTASNTSPAVGDVVSFNGSSSTAGTGHTLVSYAWNFGDGTTKTGSTTTHDFSPAGNYVVMLTVTNEIGQTSTFSGALTVH